MLKLVVTTIISSIVCTIGEAHQGKVFESTDQCFATLLAHSSKADYPPPQDLAKLANFVADKSKPIGERLDVTAKLHDSDQIRIMGSLANAPEQEKLDAVAETLKQLSYVPDAAFNLVQANAPSSIDLVLKDVDDHPQVNNDPEAVGLAGRFQPYYVFGWHYRIIVAVDQIEQYRLWGSNLVLHEFAHNIDQAFDNLTGTALSETSEFRDAHDACDWGIAFDKRRFGKNYRESFAELLGRFFSPDFKVILGAEYEPIYNYFSTAPWEI